MFLNNYESFKIEISRIIAFLAPKALTPRSSFNSSADSSTNSIPDIIFSTKQFLIFSKPRSHIQSPTSSTDQSRTAFYLKKNGNKNKLVKNFM